MNKNKFNEGMANIRKTFKLPSDVVLIYNVDKVLPVGYQYITKSADNDNEAKP